MDDLIKRNDVLLALCEKKCGCVLQECGDHPCWIAKMIIDIPAVESEGKKDVNKPEKLTAHWIATVVRDHDGIICSNCRLENTVINEVPFCPWCGAEMSESDGIYDTN